MWMEIGLLTPPIVSRSPLAKPNLDQVRQKADMLTTWLCYRGLAANTYRNCGYPLWWQSVSCCCFTHLEKSATSRHFSTISTDFLKKRLKLFFVRPQFPVLISCSMQLRLCSRP